ncbi:MAG: RdgB/HAM1 family non-canonical purine NTP pyrophosphatase [Candidatus Omnitrophota bacterium]
MKELVIATKNKDKQGELQKLLKGLRVKVITLERYPHCPEVREGVKSFCENAIRKAMFVSKYTGKPALADDTGLEVDALKGKPGVCSSRFAGKKATYDDNVRKLLQVLSGKTARQRGAQFRCLVAVCDYPRVVGVVEGKIRGRITFSPLGKHGFGYDPVFLVPHLKKTFAQLSPPEKNKISHRGLALAKAKRLIIKYWRLNA